MPVRAGDLRAFTDRTLDGESARVNLHAIDATLNVDLAPTSSPTNRRRLAVERSVTRARAQVAGPDGHFHGVVKRLREVELLRVM